MKILITGSAGMLGYDLCKILSKEYDLVGIDVSASEAKYQPNKFYEVDISKKEDVQRIFVSEKPDIVIHTAAWTDVDGCELDPEKAEQVNVTGTLNVAEACHDISSHLIVLSTDYVFDGNKGKSYLEDDKPNPLSVYGKTKLEAENIVKELLSSFVILRTSALYGSNGHNFVDTIVTKAIKDEKLRIVDDQVTAPTYTLDLALAINKVIESRSSFDYDIVNICNSGSCSWYDFALEIIKKAGIKGYSLEPMISSKLERPAKRPSYSVLDNSRFCDVSGSKLRSWKEALADYLKNTSMMGEI